MPSILEPCCKQNQFNNILHTLRKDSTNGKATLEFIHYGDVTFPDWFTFLILEAKGADAVFSFRALDLTTLNYILNRMHDHAFIPGKNLSLLNNVTISAKIIPDPLPLRATTLQAEGRLTIKTTTRKIKTETITLTPPDTTTPKYILRGKIFAQAPNAPRTILITQLSTPNSKL